MRMKFKKEGIAMKNSKNKKTSIIVEIFDSMFIMILCFATLFAALLMQKNSNNTLSYIVDLKTLAITVLGFIVYLTFLLSQSEKGLKDMINHIYSNEKKKAVKK